MIAALLALAAAPVIVFHVGDPRIAEASGIAPGLRSSGVVYVQNDSGERNRFFALNARTGATAATITVPGAENVDWEDIAVATDASGTPSVWLADTGDNGAARSEVRVYRVREPRLSADGDDRAVSTARPDVYRLRYPDGAQDAESLAVAPGGAAYVVTKAVTGTSVVYRLPARPDANAVQRLRPVGTVGLGLGGLATGAAFSRDGNTLVVRTYDEAFVWSVSAGDVAAALRRPPRRVQLPQQFQGEGVAIVGDHLLVDSEGVGQPVYSVPLPVPTRTPSAMPSSAMPSSATPSSAAITSAAPSSAPVSPAGATADGDADTGLGYAAGAVVLVVVIGAAVLLLRRNRRA